MANANPKEQPLDKHTDILKASVDKLKKGIYQQLNEKFCVSSDFSKQFDSNEAAALLCEKAMENLATGYIENLTAFKASTTLLEALKALDKAEEIWVAETAIIRHFDPRGTEGDFLTTMRGQSFAVLEDKLEEASRWCIKNPSDERVAVCLGILGVMDAILVEFGHVPEGPKRKLFRDIAKSFR